MSDLREVRVVITPRMHQIVAAARLGLDCVQHPEPQRSRMLADWRGRSMDDLWYLLTKLGLV